MNSITKDIHYILFNKQIIKYNISKNETILEWFGKNINSFLYQNLYKNLYQNLKNSIIFINEHYIVHQNAILTEIFDKLQTNIICIEIVPRIKGGGGLIDMFKSIIQIGKVFLFLIDLIIWFIKFIVWFVFFLGWLLKFLFVDLIVDFYNSLLIIIVTIFRLPIDIITGLFAFGVNSIGGWMSTIWGWEQSNLTQNDKNSNYFKSIDRMKGKKCYLTNTNTVPFSIILGTILCPPLGVFMDLGITGWFNILICMILTLMFYIPGLLYALLVIYS